MVSSGCPLNRRKHHIPIPPWLDRPRGDFLECSRVAVDPIVQNTDLFGSITKELGRQAILNGKLLLCLGRTTQRVIYSKFGWRTISKEIPHPLLDDQTLAVMCWDPRPFLQGVTCTPTVRRIVVPDVAASVERSGMPLPESIVMTGQSDLGHDTYEILRIREIANG